MLYYITYTAEFVSFISTTNIQCCRKTNYNDQHQNCIKHVLKSPMLPENLSNITEGSLQCSQIPEADDKWNIGRIYCAISFGRKCRPNIVTHNRNKMSKSVKDNVAIFLMYIFSNISVDWCQHLYLCILCFTVFVILSTKAAFLFLVVLSVLPAIHGSWWLKIINSKRK